MVDKLVFLEPEREAVALFREPPPKARSVRFDINILKRMILK